MKGTRPQRGKDAPTGLKILVKCWINQRFSQVRHLTKEVTVRQASAACVWSPAWTSHASDRGSFAEGVSPSRDGYAACLNSASLITENTLLDKSSRFFTTTLLGKISETSILIPIPMTSIPSCSRDILISFVSPA